jgi:hypothetical protein
MLRRDIQTMIRFNLIGSWSGRQTTGARLPK